jgi:hypothetical protein
VEILREAGVHIASSPARLGTTMAQALGTLLENTGT